MVISLRMEMRMEQAEPRRHFAECAACGMTNSLVRVGKLWVQPIHRCVGGEWSRLPDEGPARAAESEARG